MKRVIVFDKNCGTCNHPLVQRIVSDAYVYGRVDEIIVCRGEKGHKLCKVVDKVPALVIVDEKRKQWRYEAIGGVPIINKLLEEMDIEQ